MPPAAPFRSAVAGVFLALAASLSAAPLPENVPAFIEAHCASCHNDVDKEGGLDLGALAFAPDSPKNFAQWVKLFDRVEADEMPPKEKRRPAAADRSAFLEKLSATLLAADTAAVARDGRAIKRRLNRYEYENALRDLLDLPYLAAKDSLPEDPTAHGYNKIGEALDVSHVQMSRFLRTAETALREAMTPQIARPAVTVERHYTWQQRGGFSKAAGPNLRKTYPIVGLTLRPDLVGGRDPNPKSKDVLPVRRADLGPASTPETREDEAVVMLMSTYEPAEIKFERFRAPITGRYKLRFSGYTVWMAPDFSGVTAGRRTEPVVIYAQSPPRSLRRLGAFDFAPEKSVHEIEVWLMAGETIQPDAARLVRSRPPDFKNPLLEKDGMPGVAFQWMETEGPLTDTWPRPGHTLLFGDLALKETKTPGAKGATKTTVEVISRAPAQDAEKLLRRFMAAAYRGPLPEDDVQRFLGLIRHALKEGHSFTDSMIAGYTAVLSSPGFVYLRPTVADAQLDAHALAERLSFFLWNSPPDARLRQLAADGSLVRPATLRSEVDRLLDDPRSRRFVDAFLDYWLDLRKMSANGADAELYPEYQLDDLLVESMPQETQLFFAEMLRRDLPARTVVASDFAMLNERLATLYAIPGVTGVHLRPVPLPADSVRGGLITQGSVLKVTANGTTTSPVVRGVWVMERILGYHAAPPPAVPAVESDIRGATTIREQLAKHRSEESCNACHRKIDPAGFALESFDVMGGFRDRYRASKQGKGDAVKGFGHDGQIFRFLLGPAVDASGELPDGRTFSDIREFRRALLADEAQLARNLAQQLAVFATGAPIRFSDRAQIAQILERTRASGYGARSLIRELVQSDLFLKK